jgi:hypothetical protein
VVRTKLPRSTRPRGIRAGRPRRRSPALRSARAVGSSCGVPRRYDTIPRPRPTDRRRPRATSCAPRRAVPWSITTRFPYPLIQPAMTTPTLRPGQAFLADADVDPLHPAPAH